MEGHSRPLEIVVSIRTLLLAVAIAGLVWAFVSIIDAFLIVFIGVFLAHVFEYPTRLLMRRTGLGRGLAATIMVLGTTLVVVVLALLFLVPLVGDVRDFVKGLPDLIAELRANGQLSWLGDSAASQNVEDAANQLAGRIPQSISALLGVAGAAFTAGITIFTIIFLALFLLADMPRLKEAVASVLMPGTAERILDLWERITMTISRWAVGAVTIAFIAGIVQGGTVWLLGASYAVALGVIAGLLDLIPNIGATIAGFILVPAVWAQEGIGAAVVMLIVILVYQQIENNILTPTIQGKATEISAFFVILGVTLFGALAGVLGALVAVPITASLQLVVREYTKERRARVQAARATPPATA
jgi:predicted PurR-regulated permease PerM